MILNRLLSPAEGNQVFSELKKLLTADRFHARGVVQSHNEIEQWHVEVDRSAQQWFAVNEKNHVHEFRDDTTYHRGEQVTRPTKISDELVGPLLAAFPEQLRWWGEFDHDFRPVLIERIGKRSILLTFEHGSDPSMRSTMVIDIELGLVSRVMHFDAPYILLLDAELRRGIERIVPESFPKPEVIYPDY